jgi:hypothetical protein
LMAGDAELPVQRLDRRSIAALGCTLRIDFPFPATVQ